MTAKEVIGAYSEALSEGDIPKAFSFFSINAKWHQPGNNKFSGTKNNLDEIGKMLSCMMADTKGSLIVKPTSPLMENGNLVSSSVRFSATNDAKSMDMSGIDLFEVKEGKITQVWLFSEDQKTEDEFWG